MIAPVEDIQCYAVRRMEPFLGVLQAVETGIGRAVSTNGIVWDIELGMPVNTGWGSLGEMSHQMAYTRYGLWSADEGLINRPLSPQLEQDVYRDHATHLIQAIATSSDHMPFKLMDQYELWLFEPQNQLPLALLTSSRERPQNLIGCPKYWRCSIGREGVPSQLRFPEANELEQMVKKRAGFNVYREWIMRLADGSGVSLSTGTQYQSDTFPPYLISEDWPDAAQTRLINCFIAWIAPSLLTLQNLQPDQRSRLEHCLHVQARSVEHHWHLYPETIDMGLINAARVQCRLQQGT